MKSRRHFIKESSVALAGSLLLPSFLKADRIKTMPAGIQLYTVRNEMLADAPGTLKKIAAIGYKEIESARSDKGNYYGLSPKEIKQITADLGIKLRSGHVHIDADWQRSVDQAAEAGQEYLICAVLPSPGQTIENYRKSADAFLKAGEDCKKANLQFGYHNHDAEFETVDGRVLYDVLLEHSDPTLVKMESDLGWMVAAGKDPVDYFKKYPARFPLWHLKDMDPVKKHSTEFGKGSLHIRDLLQHAELAGMKHYFVEQEEYSNNAFESAELDYKYLQQLI